MLGVIGMATCKTRDFNQNTHKRIFEFLNTARRPEELVGLPEHDVWVDESRVFNGPDPHDVVAERSTAKKPKLLLDLKVAKHLFDARCDECHRSCVSEDKTLSRVENCSA